MSLPPEDIFTGGPHCSAHTSAAPRITGYGGVLLGGSRDSEGHAWGRVLGCTLARNKKGGEEGRRQRGGPGRVRGRVPAGHRGGSGSGGGQGVCVCASACGAGAVGAAWPGWEGHGKAGQGCTGPRRSPGGRRGAGECLRLDRLYLPWRGRPPPVPPFLLCVHPSQPPPRLGVRARACRVCLLVLPRCRCLGGLRRRRRRRAGRGRGLRLGRRRLLGLSYCRWVALLFLRLRAGAARALLPSSTGRESLRR